MQPETAIEHWRQWDTDLDSRPVILKPLCGGRSNHSFLLDSNIGKLVLRINGNGSILPGADRSCEAGVWRAASEQGIAPPLVFVDSRNQYLVSGYIESRLPARPQSDETILDPAFKLLKTCHQMNVAAPAIDYARHIEHYWQIIEAGAKLPNPALARQREAMQAMLDSLIKSNTPTGLCHHDPVIENFVGTPERLYLIDWEYAATGLQIMDYAALATEWQIDDQTILTKTNFTPETFNLAKTLYKYLCSLWEAAT